MQFDTLKNTQEFDFVYKHAKRGFSKYFVLYALNLNHFKPNNPRTQRIFSTINARSATIVLGLSISKKIGKACERNLIKRRLRAIVREKSFKDKFALIIVAKAEIKEADFKSLQSHFSGTMRHILESSSKPRDNARMHRAPNALDSTRNEMPKPHKRALPQ